MFVDVDLLTQKTNKQCFFKLGVTTANVVFPFWKVTVLYFLQPPILVLMAAAMATVKASTTCQSRRSDECLASTQEELEAVKKQLKDAVSQMKQEEDSNSSNDYRLCPLYMNNVWGC